MSLDAIVNDITQDIVDYLDRRQLESICLQFIKHLYSKSKKNPKCWKQLVFYLGEDSQPDDFEGLAFSEKQIRVIVSRLMKLESVKYGEFSCPEAFRVGECDCIKPKRILIGITGEIGCGKSTAVNYLKSKYGFTEYMFAKPLKDIAVTLGFEEHQVYGTQEQKLEVNNFWGISGREFLQKFGSEVCRDYVPKILPNMKFNDCTMWVRLFEKYYSESKSERVAVSDVRFEDESKKIKELGGIIIRINRPKKQVSQNTEHLVHKSELQADKIVPDITIENDGSLKNLYNKLDKVMKTTVQF